MRPNVRTRAGSLLVITLWLLTILSVFAIAMARYLSVEVRLTRYRLTREQAKAWARSGVYLAMQELLKDAQQSGKAYDWLGDDWALPQAEVKTAGGRVRVLSVIDEERKLYLNTATKEQLERLTRSSDAAQAVVDYLDGEDASERQVEEPPYQPKNGPVVAMEELLEIPGVTPQIFETLQRTTTASADPSQPHPLNINTASPEVLLVVAGETLGGGPSAAVIQALTAARLGPDGEAGSDDDCVVTQLQDAANKLAACTQQSPTVFAELLSKASFSVNSTTFRIQAEGDVDSPSVRYRVEAIVQRATGAQPLRVLAWREG